MNEQVILGLALPFAGTALGAAFTFLMKRELNPRLQRVLAGFAAGVMTAASLWSLLIPALEQSAVTGHWRFLPATAGFWLGTVFLLSIDKLVPRLRRFAEKDGERRTAMLIFAVTLHNIPEGMAVGAVYAGFMSGAGEVSAGCAFALALGIAVQNIPEGAIVSMPLHASGRSRVTAFAGGVLSGAAEPASAAAVLLASRIFVPTMPYCLSFAAGAMLYVAVRELIPEAEGDCGVLTFAAGFSLMMALDVALG